MPRHKTSIGCKWLFCAVVLTLLQTAKAAGATATFTATPTNGTAPLAVTFSVSSTDSLSNALSTYSWNFGDGGTSASASPTHTYTNVGTFTPTLSGTDILLFAYTATGPSITVLPQLSFVSTLGSLNTARKFQTATLLPNGLVLVAGGANTSGTVLSSAELYNPATGTWTTTGSMNNPREEHTATLLTNGWVLVAGGIDGGTLYSNAELYIPTIGIWIVTGPMNTARYIHTATLLTNGQVLVAGGDNPSSGVVSNAEIYNPALGTWTTTTNLKTGRYDHTATLLTNGLVLVTGGTDNSSVFASAELFNPVSGTWTNTGSMTNLRFLHAATLLPNGQVLVTGGFYNGSALTGAELYNPVTGTWTATNSLHTSRYEHTSTLLPDGRVLVAGGQNNTGALATGELYDPFSGTWTTTTNSLKFAREQHTATLLPSGQVLMEGGFVSNTIALASSELAVSATNAPAGTWATTGSMATGRGSLTMTWMTNGMVLAAGGLTSASSFSTAELYNPVSGTWTTTNSMNTARGSHTATLLTNGLVLVAGGDDNFQIISNAEFYNPASGTWTNTGSLNTARDLHTATLLTNGLVLVTGGEGTNGGNLLNSSELYNPVTGTWTNTGSLNTARASHTATLLTNGLVLVAAGSGIASAELYNPATGTWTNTGSLTTARSFHTATLLPNGMVLIAGGQGTNSNALSSSELYNPVTGTWTNTGSLNTPRYNHTAALLPNGLVLVAGGESSAGVTNSVELYNPATGTWTVSGSLNAARYSQSATLLPNGLVLMAGGFLNGLQLSSAELYNVGLGFNPSWQPQITSALSFVYSNFFLILVNGSGFRGISEGSGGNGSQDSPADYPVVQVRSLENAQTAFLSPGVWSATNYISTPLSNFPSGYALVTATVNGIPSASSVVVLGGPTVVSCAPPPPGLASWWQGENNALDTVFQDDGFLVGGVTFTNGEVGQAFNLDGSTGFIGTSTLIANPQTFSLSLWFKTSTSRGGVLISFDSTQTNLTGSLFDRNIYMDNSGRLYFGIWNGSPQQISSIASGYNDNNWHLAVGTFSASSGLTFYMDGVQQGNNPTVTSDSDVYNGFWRIGEDNLNNWPNLPSSLYFAGEIDEVAVFNNAISSNEVASIFHAGSAGMCANELPPYIVAAPTNQALLAGSSATFSVTVTGGAPFTFQWSLNSSNLADNAQVSGSQSNVLVLSNATPAESGVYDLTVSNAYGITNVFVVLAVTSSNNSPTSFGLVSNGGFETGDLSGWTQAGNSFVTIALVAHSGSFSAEFGGVSIPAAISQNIATSPGATYLLSFWVDSPDGYMPNEFIAQWNGQTLMADANLPAIGWTNMQFLVTATGTNTLLEFSGVDYSSFLYLDDIVLESDFLQFNATPTAGTGPLTVHFTSPATDSLGNTITHWAWDFGNGATSTARNPSHTYTNIGSTYAPTLQATNSQGATVSGFGPTVTVLQPTFQVTASPTQGPSPLTVQFTTPSRDNYGTLITNWSWNFGDDSGFSSAQNPSYTYSGPSFTYLPTLTAINANGVTIFPAVPAINVAPYSGLVLNGGFETSPYFTGWTLSGDVVNSLVDDGSSSSIPPEEGSYLAALQTLITFGYMSQNLATTPGSNYLVSFWLNAPLNGIPNEFQVFWAGNKAFDSNDIVTSGWTNLQLVLNAPGTNTVLQFGFLNDNNYFGLDNVSVTPSTGIVATIYTPGDGSSFATGQTVPITATAVALHGIQSLAIYTNGGLVFSVPTNNITINLGITNGGSYTITAVATDTNGATGTSAPVYITVNAPGTQLINFDVLDASAGPVGSPTLDNYLSGYGVTETNNSPNATLAVQNDQNISGGTLTVASSGHNLLTQIGTNGAISYTLAFTPFCTQVSWVRTALLTSGSGVVSPAWTAYAYDGFGNELGQVGEDQTFSITNIPAATFSLTASNIASITFAGNNSLSGLATLPLDDLLLSTNAIGPTPTISLTASNFSASAPGQATLNALASEAGGAISRVDFYANQVFRESAINPTPGSPFSVSLPLTDLGPGSYTVYAVATDTNGVTTASSNLVLTVTNTPGVAVIDFDDPVLLDTSSGSVGGASLSNYLAGFGVSIGTATLGTRVEAINQNSFAGSALPVPPSPPNLLTQVGSSKPVVFRLDFATNPQSVSFTRVGVLASGTSSISLPSWTARILDGSGNELESAHEPLTFSTNDVSPRAFTLVGSNIASLRFNSDSHQTAAFAGVLLDDLILNAPATNPLSVTLTTNGGTLTAPTNITLTATAADTFTNIDYVAFYSGPTIIGTVTNSPYVFTWTNVLNGTYIVKAKVVDVYGYGLFSAPITITVLPGGLATTVNFDSLPATLGAVSGAPLAAYLASNGMSITSNSPGSTVAVENEANVAGGGFTTASSASNLLTQTGSPEPLSFTVGFSNLLTQFSFTRPELLANPSVTHPAWQVSAFDPLGNVLDSAQEPMIAADTNVPAATYTLTGPGIASVEFDSDGTGFTTFPGMLLDDFVLTGGLSVVITNPPNGEIAASGQVPITAEIGDTNGTVTNVSFYFDGTNLIGSAQSSPFSIAWNAPSNGAYSLTVVALDNVGQSATSPPVAITVATGFAIVKPPASQTVGVSNNVTFRTTTTGSNGIAFQWFVNGTSLPGQTNKVLKITSVQHSDAGSYVVVATGNGLSVTSQPPAVLTVLDPPVAAVPTQTPSTVNIGDTVTLQEFATPTNNPLPFTYQWRLNGASIPGATNSSYTISNALPLNSGNYRVVVGNGPAYSVSPFQHVAVKFGSGAIPTTNDTFATSLAFDPLVSPVAGLNSNSPASGELAKIAGKPAGRFLWYNWTARFTGVISLTTRGSSFDTLLGVFTGTNVASLTRVAEDDDTGGFFTSKVTFNCTQGVTYQIAVAGFKGASGLIILGLPAGTGYRVLDPTPGDSVPIITQQPSNQIVNLGDTVTLGVTASNATGYQWFFADAPVLGAITNTFIISNFPPGAVGNYYALAANSVGSAQSATATIEIATQTNQGTPAAPATLSVDKFGDAVDLTGPGMADHYRPADSGGDVGGFTLSQSFSTLGATKEDGEPNHAGQPGGASYWYAYTSPVGGMAQFDTVGSTFNTILAVYTGPGTSFSSLVNVGADYTTNYVLNGQPVILVSNVVSGATFYIAIDGYLGASGAARLNVTLNPPTNAAANTNVPPITNNSVIVAVTAPVNNYLTTSSNLAIRGTVRGNGKGLGKTTIGITVNTNAPVAATLGSAAAVTAWSATNVTLSQGANVVTAQGFSQNSDGTTNASAPVTRTVFLVSALPTSANKSTLTLLTGGKGRITGEPDNASLEVNKIYKVTAVPAANSMFTNWTSGTNTNSMAPLAPNAAALSFVMTSNLILQANFVTNPFPAVAGVYNGLFAPTNGVTEDSSGFFTATIPSAGKGAYSAKLLLDGGSYPFSGSFDLSGDAGTSVTRAGKSSVVVELHLNLATPDDQITGTIINGANPGWFSQLQADRAVFNARSNPATNYAGRYTLLFPPGTNAPTNSPGGYGYATLTNNTAGTAALIGKLGDGAAISQLVPISKDGYIPVYASLYSRLGALLGWLEVTNNPSNTPPKTILGNNLAWIKLTSKGRALYAAGFTNTNITVLGSLYVPPSRGGAVLPLLTNATLIISNGDLGISLVYSNMTISGDKLVNGAGNPPNPITGVITPSTGVLSLTFRPPGANHNTTASGVLLQDYTSTNAAGWFLGTDQSGFFLLEQ